MKNDTSYWVERELAITNEEDEDLQEDFAEELDRIYFDLLESNPEMA